MTPTTNELVDELRAMDIAMGYNSLAYNTYKTGPLEWDRAPQQRAWTDADDARLYALLQDSIGLKSDRDYYRAATIYADDRRYDPLTDLLDSLVWDGTPRAGTLFASYLGAAPTEYTTAVEQLWLSEAIERAYHPGAKCDYTPVLAGPGGIGKSTFARKMALDDAYYTDCVGDIGDVKRTGEVIRSKWIVELAELAGLSGKALEAVKAGLTRQTDEYRGAYCRRTASHPRRAIFIASTNETDFIRDRSTGARRFLPIQCGLFRPKASVLNDEFPSVAKQVWAEVVHWAASGDPRYRLTLSADMELEAARQRESCMEEDPLIQPVLDYLARNANHPICTKEVIERALRLKPTAKLCKQVARVIANDCPGWVQDGKRLCGKYGKQRCWVYRSSGQGAGDGADPIDAGTV